MREKDTYRDNLAAIKEAYPGAKTLSVDQVAEYLSVDRRTVTSLIKDGAIKAIDTNPKGTYKKYRVTIEALARL